MTNVSSSTHSELQPSEHLKVEGSIWLPLNVVSNGNASSSSQAVGVTKIAKSVIAPLAQQHVSVFMLSTYQTDFILVGLLLCSPDLKTPATLNLMTSCSFNTNIPCDDFLPWIACRCARVTYLWSSAHWRRNSVSSRRWEESPSLCILRMFPTDSRKMGEKVLLTSRRHDFAGFPNE